MAQYQLLYQFVVSRFDANETEISEICEIQLESYFFNACGESEAADMAQKFFDETISPEMQRRGYVGVNTLLMVCESYLDWQPKK